ncbi:response regulator [Taibaiella koreensis]|uniref:hypothetical protein n=1 Tax=Taibaiella koreensis TaxID=1268548 RepID=UPI000E59F95A|nr:hypothetical protein [Taibaiella koreensis]
MLALISTNQQFLELGIISILQRNVPFLQTIAVLPSQSISGICASPDLLILDLNRLAEYIYEGELYKLKEHNPQLKILVLTEHADEAFRYVQSIGAIPINLKSTCEEITKVIGETIRQI